MNRHKCVNTVLCNAGQELAVSCDMRLVAHLFAAVASHSFEEVKRANQVVVIILKRLGNRLAYLNSKAKQLRHG